MSVLRRSVLFSAAAAGLYLAQLGCSGNTMQVSGCMNDDQCPTGQMCRSDGVCVPKPTYATITVVKLGDGSGTVTSMPSGIDCGNTCSAQFQVGSKATLIANAASGSQFLSFTVGCSSTNPSCDVTPQNTDGIRVLVNFSPSGSNLPPAQCNASGFCWENPRPAGNRLRDSVAVGTGEAWAVGDAGTIVHALGTTLTLVPSGTTRNLTGIWGVSSDLYAVGEGATILHGVNGSFSPESPPAGVTADLFDVWSGGGVAFAVGAGGTILRRNATWSSDTSNTVAELHGIFANNFSDIWAVGAGGTTVHYNGSAWSSTAEPAFGGRLMRGVIGGAGPLFAIDASGGIYRYSAGWTSLRNNASESMYGLTLIGGVPYFAGTNGVGLVQHYDGSSFVPDVTGTADYFRSVAGLTTTDLWSVGESGTVWHLSGTWGQVTNSPTVAMNSVWATDAQNAWAVGNNGTLMKYNGSAYSAVSLGTAAALNGVWASGPSDVWIAGNGGLLMHYDGTSWKSVNSGTGQNLRAIYGLAASRVWAVGDSGTVITYDGTSWTSMITGSGASLRAVWGTAQNDVWAAGESGYVFHSTGGAFSTVTPGPTTTTTIGGMWGSGLNDFWISADSQLFHYQSGTWTPVTPSPAVTGLRGVWGTLASDIYAVASGGVLLHYDGGLWSRIQTGAGPDLAAVMASGRKLWVVGSGGTILRHDY